VLQQGYNRAATAACPEEGAAPLRPGSATELQQLTLQQSFSSAQSSGTSSGSATELQQLKLQQFQKLQQSFSSAQSSGTSSEEAASFLSPGSRMATAATELQQLQQSCNSSEAELQQSRNRAGSCAAPEERASNSSLIGHGFCGNNLNKLLTGISDIVAKSPETPQHGLPPACIAAKSGLS
jgi:hypothetical protein